MLYSRIKKIIICLAFLIGFIIWIKLFMFFTVPYPSLSKLMWNDLYKKNEKYDTLFIGTSLCYLGVNPQILDEKLNKKHFVLATPGQSSKDSYYALREFYKYNETDLVFLEITRNRFRRTESIFTSKITMDYMKFSLNKIEYIINAFPADYRIKALFPGIQAIDLERLKPINMFRLAREKIKNPEKREVYSEKGIYMGNGFVLYDRFLRDSEKMGRWLITEWKEESVDPEALEYIEKSIEFCKSKGSKVILIYNPILAYSMRQITNYEELHEYILNFANKNDVPFLDFNYIKREFYSRDNNYYWDYSHKNKYGAEAFSNCLAQFIVDYNKNTYNEKKYFYDNYDEAMEAWGQVFGVWMEIDKDTGVLMANSVIPPNKQVEYEYSIISNEGKYVVYRTYDENSLAETELLTPGEYEIRVNARLVGSKEAYEQYNTIKYNNIN